MAGTVGHAQQYYDYFIVLDFEAQCEREKQLFPQEIIEFPALLVDAKTLETVSEFHHYVQPTVHTQLTGSAQSSRASRKNVLMANRTCQQY